MHNGRTPALQPTSFTSFTGQCAPQISPWVSALLWTTSATDRLVCEPATIAAARLLGRHPNQAAGLIELFTLVNEEWVVERALEVAHSALLANGA